MLNRVPDCGGWRFQLWWWAKRRQNRFVRRYLRDWERIAGETQNKLVHAEGANHDYRQALDRQQAEITQLEAALAAALAPKLEEARQCDARTVYFGRCVLRVGHVGEHLSARDGYFSWPEPAAALAPPVTFSETTVFVPHQPGPGTTTGCGTIAGSVFDPNCNAVNFEQASYVVPNAVTDGEADSAQRVALATVSCDKCADKSTAFAVTELREALELLTACSASMYASATQLVIVRARQVAAAALAPQPEKAE